MQTKVSGIKVGQKIYIGAAHMGRVIQELLSKPTQGIDLKTSQKLSLPTSLRTDELELAATILKLNPKKSLGNDLFFKE
jgi:hypothetical protein